jgi:2-haloacid dehalogenase
MSAPEALAFDMYGTLVDPIRIWKQLEQYIPDEDALRVAEVWRQKQLELTFRLIVMERYEDFEWITRKALDYALAVAGQEFEADQKDVLIAQYNNLERFDDADSGLKRLKEAGHEMVVFSNGTPDMLQATLDQEGLHQYFQGFVSVDEVKVYKPSPKVYRHVADRLGRPIEEVWLISSNPFDDVGAEAAGMRAVWVDRSGGLFDPLGSPPEIIVETLTELADAMESRQR